MCPSPSSAGALSAGVAPGAYLAADGETLYTNAPDGVLAWDLRPAAQALSACVLAGRELSAEEWATYFPGEAKVDTCAMLAN